MCWLLNPGASANELARFDSVRGPVQLVDEGGRAALLIDSGARIQLPSDWRQTSVAMSAKLAGSQTAFVVSYADRRCEARQALMVITPSRVWGPYALGDCEDAMAFQVSARGDALVAIRADGTTQRAWVYTSDDNAFRGPTDVVLPSKLSSLVSTLPTPAAPASAVARVVRPIPEARAVLAAPAARAKNPVPPPVPPANVVPLPAAAPVQSQPTTLSKADAGTISQQVKASTKPQTRVTLDLS